MDQSKIPVRYAKAFLALAKDKNLLTDLKHDIELVFHVCNSSADFILLLEIPIVKTSEKQKIITSVFEGKVNEYTLKFLRLITQNNREVYIPGICRNFLELTRKVQNIKSVELTTAIEISAENINRIKSLLEKELNARVEISGKVNPKIIGGLILRLDDKQYDASVATKLKSIKQELMKTDVKKSVQSDKNN
ncbi:MAG: ATP synthase F1 subunit delta [Prolixibacteraceae bacterium]